MMDQPGLLSEKSARVVSSRKLLARNRRIAAGEFLVDGPQAVREALQYAVVSQLFLDAAVVERLAPINQIAVAAGIPVRLCTTKAIAALTESVTPQGVVAQCAMLEASLADLRRPQLLAIPLEVRDPGNAGAIIRCADAAGADGVVVAGDSVDIYNAKVVRSSAGSLFHLPIVRTDDVVGLINGLRSRGMTVIATEGEAPSNLDEVIDAGQLAGPTAWLFGNEAHGLPDDVAQLADLRVRIPILGKAESLNLATAAAVCLFASARAHRGIDTNQ